jgi:hypothetical protein
MKKKILKQLKDRRLIIVFFVLFFVLNGIILYNTFSEKTTSTVWDGTVAKKFASGDGSVRNPYIINNGSELALLFQEIYSENSVNYFDKFYEINNNIDLNGYDFSFAKSGMTFSGHINGNGYSISNFTISGNYTSLDGKSIDYSLFDSLFNANISNINFRDITFNVEKVDIKSEKTEEKQEEDENIGEPVALLSEDEIKEDGENIEEQVVDKNENSFEEGIDSGNIVSDSVDENDNQLDEETNDFSEVAEEPTNNIETEKVEIEKITVSLFKNVEQSNINNITIDNVTLNIEERSLDIESSLFILNDNGKNNFENISLSNEYSKINSPMFIFNYNNSTIKNIVFTSNGLPLINNYDSNSSDTIFEYYIDNGIMTFKKDYSTN